MEHLLDTPIVVEEHINGDISRKGKGKRKALDEEVVIDLEDEYEGDSEVEIQGNTRCEANVEDENDNVDEQYVANSEDDSDFEENWDWATVLPQETVNEVCSNVGSIENVMNLDPIMTAKFEVENDDSDILVTPKGSENDEPTRT